MYALQATFTRQIVYLVTVTNYTPLETKYHLFMFSSLVKLRYFILFCFKKNSDIIAFIVIVKLGKGMTNNY